jgi:hypothetical protein
VIFGLSAADLTNVGGGDSLAAVLVNVIELRILSSPFPDYRGESIISTLGMDNLTAAPEPASLSLLVLGAAAALRRSRRAKPQQ